MGIYAQHGHGKSDKVEVALRQGTISGVILSPKDESPTNITNYIGGLRREFGTRVSVLFDPQFYATVNGSRLGNLPDYPYFRPGLTRSNFIAPGDITQYVNGTLNYQLNLGVDRLISPAVLVSDLRDPWSQISLSMALEAIAFRSRQVGAPELLLSLILDENAFRGKEALDEILDIVTAWDVKGFYIVVRRNDTSYQAAFDPDVLGNILYLVHVLSNLNDFELVFGYSDLCGVLLQAVGATVTSTGWHNSLRQFSMNRFLPSTGGRTPRPRYTSSSLLNSILILPELQAIQRIGSLSQVISGSFYDGVMRGGNPTNAPWPLSVSTLHHWEVLSRTCSEILSSGSIQQRLDALESRVRQAIALYTLLEQGGAVFEQATGQGQLQTWLRALRSFRYEVRV
jgi:hypothetical protein